LTQLKSSAVLKFGGSLIDLSGANIPLIIKRISKIKQAKNFGPIVVVSAPKGFTDRLQAIGEAKARGQDYRGRTHSLDFVFGSYLGLASDHVRKDLIKEFEKELDKYKIVVQDAIQKSYRNNGIDIKSLEYSEGLPTFDDVKDMLETRLHMLRDQKKSTQTLETLLVRLRPLFNTGFFSKKSATIPFDKIFKSTTVLKLRDLPTDEVKYAVAEFFLNKLKYELYSRGKKSNLVLYCIVDEAHRLLDEQSPLNDLLRESRKYGTGFILSSQRPSDFSEIVLAINLDLAGYHEGKTAYSLYGCPDEIAAAIRKAFSSQEDTVEGEPWYQSDHSIFIQNQVPAMAITSDRLMELSTHITHTDKDRPELIDLAKLESIALALRDLLLDLDRILS